MRLREMLKGDQTFLFDGAIGTQLDARGLDQRSVQNILYPEIVRSIQEEYVRAGAQVLITNTLTSNRLWLEACGRGDDVDAINRAGVELARAAAGNRFVLGDIGSTGKLLEPYGDAKEQDLTICFCEQATILAQSGVDGFIVETMIDLREAVCALRACRQIASIPVFVSVSFSTMKGGGRTAMGNTPEECATVLGREGADAIGVNCGTLDPIEVSQIIAQFREKTSLPLIAQPNAGSPAMVNGKAMFQLGAEEFAHGLAECIRCGARFVGGCCGTSPAHIHAAAKIIGGEIEQ